MVNFTFEICQGVNEKKRLRTPDLPELTESSGEISSYVDAAMYYSNENKLEGTSRTL